MSTSRGAGREFPNRMAAKMLCQSLRSMPASTALLTERVTHLNALHHFEAQSLPCGAVLSATFKPWMLQNLQHR